MKKLDLDTYGVNELNGQKVLMYDGGSIWGWIAAAVSAIPDYFKGMGEGYAWAKKNLN